MQVGPDASFVILHLKEGQAKVEEGLATFAICLVQLLAGRHFELLPVPSLDDFKALILEVYFFLRRL